MAIQVQEFFDKNTSTLTYVVFDPHTRDAVVIDPVLDFEPGDGRVWSESVKKVLSYLESQNLKPHFILETHIHADHLSGAQLIKKKYPQVKTVISENIRRVQQNFQKLFNLKNFEANGEQFDTLVKNGDRLQAGSLMFQVLATPGHTPACVSFLIEDHLFTGDSIFMPDSGTGRCDFPDGSADTMYRSITEKIYRLPDATKIFVGHDYQPHQRPLQFMTTVGEQKKSNIHITADTTLHKYVEFRTARDKTLSAPRLLLPSLQVNMTGGHLPEPDSEGLIHLKMPLKVQVE